MSTATAGSDYRTRLRGYAAIAGGARTPEERAAVFPQGTCAVCGRKAPSPPKWVPKSVRLAPSVCRHCVVFVNRPDLADYYARKMDFSAQLIATILGASVLGFAALVAFGVVAGIARVSTGLALAPAVFGATLYMGGAQVVAMMALVLFRAKHVKGRWPPASRVLKVFAALYFGVPLLMALVSNPAAAMLLLLAELAFACVIYSLFKD